MKQENEKNQNISIIDLLTKIAVTGCFVFGLYILVSFVFLIGLAIFFTHEPDCITKKTTNPKHLEKLLKNNKCSHCYLGDADLSKKNLAKADLKSARLVAAKLDGANLQGANLSKALIYMELFSALLTYKMPILAMPI